MSLRFACLHSTCAESSLVLKASARRDEFASGKIYMFAPPTVAAAPPPEEPSSRLWARPSSATNWPTDLLVPQSYVLLRLRPKIQANVRMFISRLPLKASCCSALCFSRCWSCSVSLAAKYSRRGGSRRIPINHRTRSFLSASRLADEASLPPPPPKLSAHSAGRPYLRLRPQLRLLFSRRRRRLSLGARKTPTAGRENALTFSSLTCAARW